MRFEGADGTQPVNNNNFNTNNIGNNQTDRPQRRSSGTTTSQTKSHIREDLLFNGTNVA